METYEDLSARVLVDFEDVKEGLEEILDEIRSLRTDSFIRKILSRDDIERIKDWENTLKKRAEDEFSVVIMGDFKRGKSTLINAILSKAVAPTNVSPETMTINRISYGEASKREAVLKNGKRIRLNVEELNRDTLVEIMERLPAPIDYVEIQEDLPILKEITIVDTPGLGDILHSFEVQVQEYLNRADAVIYVASVLSPLSESEQAYLCANILPQKFTGLMVVANMADCLDTVEDIERVKAEMLKRVLAFSDNAGIYALSALDEYCRKCALKRPNPELEQYLENAFLEFESAMQNEIVLQKDFIKTQRVLVLARAMSSDIRKRLEVIVSMLKLNQSQLEEVSRSCEEEHVNLHHTLKREEETLTSATDQLYFEAKDWMMEFLERLNQEIQRVQTSGQTVTIQKHFQFYLMDTVQEAILKCLEAHQKVLAEKLQSLAREFSGQTLFEGTSFKTSEMAVNIADISWTGVDTATFLLTNGTYLLGLTESPLSIHVVAQTIAGFVRESQVKKKQADLLKPVLDNYDTLKDKIFAQLRTAYDSLRTQAIEKLKASYEAQIKASMEAVRQAMEVSRQEELKAEDVEVQLNTACQILDQVDEIIARYQ